jgi:hypothetical protein
VRLTLSSDKPLAQIAVRLCCVDKTGASSRITYGILNLCCRDSFEFPEALVPGKAHDVVLRLDDVAYRLPKGHWLRLSVSNAYWPMIWPSPESAVLELLAGRVEIPVRAEAAGGEAGFEAPEAAPPWRIEKLREPSNHREYSADPMSGESVLQIVDDFGVVRDLEHGLETGSTARETWRIHPDNPQSARVQTHWTQELARGDWRVRTEAFSSMWSDAEMFHLEGRVEAYEHGRLIFSRDFSESINRGFL